MVERQDTTLRALITTSTTSLPFPFGGMNTETVPLLGLYLPSLEPFKTVLVPFAMVLYYRHYSWAATRASKMATDPCHICRFTFHFKGLHSTLEHFTVFAPLKLHCLHFTITSSFRVLHKSEGMVVCF